MTAYFFFRQKSFLHLREGKCLYKFYSLLLLIIQLVSFLVGLRTYQHPLYITCTEYFSTLYSDGDNKF